MLSNKIQSPQALTRLCAFQIGFSCSSPVVDHNKSVPGEGGGWHILTDLCQKWGV